MTRELTIAIAGNPNAGKTTIFNALTGARQHVGNWPGVTVERKEGRLTHAGRELHIVDLPGTYSLTAYSLEEIIARKYIVEDSPDVILNVVDASNLERNLYLSTQLLEMGVKVVVALNMIDVATGRGIRIDHKRLSELLRAPVVPTNGKKGIGIKDLLDELVKQADISEAPPAAQGLGYGAELEEEIAKIQALLQGSQTALEGLSPRWLSVKLLEDDPEIAHSIGEDQPAVAQQVEDSRAHIEDIFGDDAEIILSDARYGFISGALKQSVTVEASDRVHLSESIDRVLTNRLLGPALLFCVLYLVYLFTFDGSQPVVAVFESFFAWLSQTVSQLLPDGLLKSLIVSGVIDGVGGVLGFTPLIAFMFFAIAILEDTGYMARIAFMLDRVLRGFGLHGASMLALMVSGGIAGGCAVPGIMATRTMKEPKERLVTILVAPLMNCGAKLPVYALLIGAFFTTDKARVMFILTIISWGMALTAARVIRSTVLSGPSAPFVLELPPYRVPTLRGLLIHTWERTWMYVKKAGTVILAISVLLWAVMTFPGLSADQVARYDKLQQELTASFLAKPAVAAVFSSEAALDRFETYRRQMAEGAKLPKNPTYDQLMSDSPPENIRDAAKAWEQFNDKRTDLGRQRQVERLRSTLGGRIGVMLEWVFKPIGFDWRTNIALVGGFAAKEVVVSTLGTAYSLGEVDPDSSTTLSDRLKREPGWNPLKAFALIMFVMLYAPCFVTLLVIRKETGKWSWTLFAMAYTTTLAYCVALVVTLVGSFLGIGVG